MTKIYSICFKIHSTDEVYLRTFCSSPSKAKRVYDYLSRIYDVVCEPIDYTLDLYDYLASDFESNNNDN